ncbi:hypothetical protein CCAE64S_02440 [Castellaniella caeni]
MIPTPDKTKAPVAAEALEEKRNATQVIPIAQRMGNARAFAREAAHVAQRYPVFPCKSDKTPHIKGWPANATQDPAQIARWAEQWPDALIGVPTGAVSGLLVLDVDVDPAKGKDGFAALAAAGIELPDTRKHLTRRGGAHYLLNYPLWAEKMRSTTDAGGLDGVDVRGDGGYVIWWPACGGEVENPQTYAEVPQWLEDVMQAGHKAVADALPSAGTPILTREQAEQCLAVLDPGMGYGAWARIGMALHHELGDDGLEVWDGWSSGGANYAGLDDLRGHWASFGKPSGNPITGRYLVKLANEQGAGIDLREAASLDEFEDVTPTVREQDERAEREIAALDAKRREHQKRENERIGEGAYRIPIAEKITLESALERFVFLSEGSLVADVFNPHYVLKLADWKNTYAASTREVAGAPGKPPRAVPVAQLWHTAEARKTATTRTFKAGGALMLPDPDGKLAVNSWRPFDRSLQVADPQAAGLGLFLDHVAFLFGDDAPRFLDWLAHIEQQPGVLPHTSWLHIARNFGTGRNWLASVLTRVWAGSVAANLDVMHMFKSSFNGQLSRKVLAVVDEIREGGRDSQWEHSEKLKSTITEEVRHINPKYGHVSVEFNACRWLLFSNHLSAIPLENGDRRVEVTATDAPPKEPAYYTRLYAALESRVFIAAVAAFLGRRDISGFNPGAHARNTEAKRAATAASRTPMAEACQLLVEHWPADFITSAHLYNVMTEGLGRDSLKAAFRRTYEQAGIRPFGRKVRINGVPTNVLILRNTAHWLRQGTAEDVSKAYKCVDFDPFAANAYEFLLGLAADA